MVQYDCYRYKEHENQENDDQPYLAFTSELLSVFCTNSAIQNMAITRKLWVHLYAVGMGV